MESGNKLVVEVPEQRTDVPNKPTYKKIPEADVLENVIGDYLKNSKSNMSKENGDACQDGADEKMLAPKDGVDVKFISADQNGDAKIDIDNIRQVFSGMAKEELMKYANDPFWIKVRWILFVCFWLLWVGMLAGAIAIIVGAPKCAAPAPKTWYSKTLLSIIKSLGTTFEWEQGPLVEINVNPSTGELSQAGLEALGHPEDSAMTPEDLQILQDLGATGVVLTLPENFNIYDGNYTYIERIVKAASDADLAVILSVQANFVPRNSDIFLKSERRESPFDNHFIWADGKSGREPNNWNSIVNGSAWSQSGLRGQYYLHQFGPEKPDLNFNNKDVQTMFQSALKRWAELGIAGVRLSHAKYLLVDEGLQDEAISSAPGPVHTDYEFLSHARTSNQPGLAPLLKQWRVAFLNYTRNEGVFFLKEDNDHPSAFHINGSLVVDLPGASRALEVFSKTDISASELLKSLPVQRVSGWPHWQYSSAQKDQISEHNIVAMLLPGVPIIDLQQLLGQNRSLEPLSKALIDVRHSPSVQHGMFSPFLVANETVFAYSRLKSGNPGILVLYNPGAELVTVNMTDVRSIPTEVSVLLTSENYSVDSVIVKTKLQSDAIKISERAAMVLSYVPITK